MGGETNPNMLIAPAPKTAARTSKRAISVEKLGEVLKRFEISIVDANDLAILQDYQIVIIADDSGSMDNPSVPPEMRRLDVVAPTRWEELQNTVANIVDIASCFDDNGIDVHFLNRSAVMGVKGTTDPRFVKAFEEPPEGTTPLTETIERVAEVSLSERNVLLFVLTDGEPDGGSEEFKESVGRLISSGGTHGRKLRIQLMVCTPLEDEVRWLNDMDRELPEVDVTDDYHTEHNQVLAAQRAEKFTRGDWCMKAMLGPVSEKFDDWDERKKTVMEDPGAERHICASCALQ
mmetsp:Transcript_124828/g.361093  ORF Transcript_124828/g.361093 Transcript_124828/m.361093 type:complete len:290 (+) Transcript_124828:48-917(+)